MKKYFAYLLRAALILFVIAIALSPLFANLSELESGGVTLTPLGYLPVALRPGNTATPTMTPVGTSTPTPTNTVPSPANVRISFIEYNPPGDDVAGEFIELTNFGGTAQDIEGWSIVPTTFLAQGTEAVLHDPFYFPTEILNPGETVRVWTKIGIVNPPNYYWNAITEIWLNGGDTARLYDDVFNEVDVCDYPGGGQNTTCD